MELPKFDRPEIGCVNMVNVFGYQDSFHPVLSEKRYPEKLINVMLRIQRLIYGEGIRVAEFFKVYRYFKIAK